MNIVDHKGLDHLFSQLSAGQMPNFLDVMSALSDVSTIFPEPDSNEYQLAEPVKPSCQVDIYPLGSQGDWCPTCG